MSDDFGMELGFSNVDIAEYQRVFPDPKSKCFNMIKHWQRTKLDQGQVSALHLLYYIVHGDFYSFKY